MGPDTRELQNEEKSGEDIKLWNQFDSVYRRYLSIGKYLSLIRCIRSFLHELLWFRRKHGKKNKEPSHWYKYPLARFLEINKETRDHELSFRVSDFVTTRKIANYMLLDSLKRG